MASEGYPGSHQAEEGYRGPVLHSAAMEWKPVPGKVVGVEEKTLANKSENPGQLWVSQARLLPGGVFPKHHHPYPQMFIFLEGEGVVELDGERVPVGPGTVVRMFRGESHMVLNESDRDLVLFQIALPLWRPAGGGEEEA
ncbi:MAG: cupin domain-containing protein [Dehalococcoidia bacterium]